MRASSGDVVPTAATIARAAVIIKGVSRIVELPLSPCFAVSITWHLPANTNAFLYPLSPAQNAYLALKPNLRVGHQAAGNDVKIWPPVTPFLSLWVRPAVATKPVLPSKYLENQGPQDLAMLRRNMCR